MAEYAYEPVPGLPERLPPGEALLWQGAPRWQSLARDAFHVRAVAFYFLALLILRLAWTLNAGAPLSEALGGAMWLAILAALALGLLVLLAWAMGRAALYSMTNRRVVLRIGAALPMAINVPFNLITSAGLRLRADGSGDIPLTLSGPVHGGYIILWPHTRPWHFLHPQPMLRSVPDAASVAQTLAAALTAARAGSTQPEAATDEPDDSAEAPPHILSAGSATTIEPAVGVTLH